MIKFQSPYQTILIELLSFYPTLLLLCSNFQVESLDHNFLKFIIPKLDKTVHRSYSNLSGSSELFVNCLHFRLVTIKREKLCLLVSSYILILLSVQLVMFTGVLWMPEWLKLCKLSEHLHGNEDQEWGILMIYTQKSWKREFCFYFLNENPVAIQALKLGKFVDGKKLSFISQYSMGITTANFFIR